MNERIRRERLFDGGMMLGLLFLIVFAIYLIAGGRDGIGRKNEYSGESVISPGEGDAAEGPVIDAITENRELASMCGPIEAAAEVIMNGSGEALLRVLPAEYVLNTLPNGLGGVLGLKLSASLIAGIIADRFGKTENIRCELVSFTPIEGEALLVALRELDALKMKDLPQTVRKVCIEIHYEKNGEAHETALYARLIEIGGEWFFHPSDARALIEASDEQ